MLKKMTIKNQITISVTLILGVIIITQFVLYSILQKENNSIINSIFDSIAQNSVQQIEEINYEISKTSSLLSIHQLTQGNLYYYDSVDIIRNYPSTQNLLSDYLAGNPNMVFLAIVKDNELFSTSYSVDLYDQASKIIETISPPTNFNSIFLPSFTYENKIYFPCVTPIFAADIAYYSENNFKNYVLCIYKMDPVNFVPSGIWDNSGISMYITDSDNRIMLSNEVAEHGKIFDINQYDRSFTHRTAKLSQLDWNVNIVMSTSNISVFSHLTNFFIIFMIVFSSILLFLLLRLLNNLIVKRILALNKNVEKIPYNDTSYRVSYNFNDELSSTASTINIVLDKVHNLNHEKIDTLNRLHQSELLQKQTQIFYLYSQISPHFLYNSLAHIQGLALDYNVMPIVTLTSSFAKIFRYFSNNQGLSTVKQDLDCAIEYFNIINSRRLNKHQLIDNTSKVLHKIPCLKMIFQPILENVLKHAYSFEDSGTVTISSVNHETKVIIEISDDGKGIPHDKLQFIRQQLVKDDFIDLQDEQHIGFTNINLRLKLYYNSDCGIEIESEENRGTTVRVIFEKNITNKL